MACKDKNKSRAYDALYRRKHRVRIAANMKIYNQVNRKEIAASQARYRLLVKIEVIRAYGGKCACCGEARLPFLTIDHVNGGGRQHRIKLKLSGNKFYAWLRNNDYPKSEFRVLCFNCNCAISVAGICPHKW